MCPSCRQHDSGCSPLIPAVRWNPHNVHHNCRHWTLLTWHLHRAYTFLHDSQLPCQSTVFVPLRHPGGLAHVNPRWPRRRNCHHPMVPCRAVYTTALDHPWIRIAPSETRGGPRQLRRRMDPCRQQAMDSLRLSYCSYLGNFMENGKTCRLWILVREWQNETAFAKGLILDRFELICVAKRL